MNAFALELRRDRSLALWLGITLLLYGAMMGALYPFILANEELIRAYMEAFPAEIMAAFGMTGFLSDPGVFFHTYVASWMWPIVAGAGGILAGSRLAADLDRGFLDLPLATPLTRVRYLTAGIAGQVVIMAVLALASVAGILAVGALVGAGFDPVRFLLAAVLAFAFGCAIAAVTTLLAVVTLSRGTASGIVLGTLIAMYLLFIVVQVAPAWDWLEPFTAFTYFRTAEIIDGGVVPVRDLVVFAAVAVGAWTGALAAFRQRDLVA
jgi:ABC-2 type transport system permease protein